MSKLPREDTEPWYKQFWPWFIIALPGTVVVASMFTIYLAVKTSDGLVVDDYYKEGLAYNKKVERDKAAATKGISGEILLNPDRKLLEFRLSGHYPPDTLNIRLIYATMARFDQDISASHIGNGIYRGNYSSLNEGKWHLLVEPDSKEWRLKGTMNYPSSLAINLTPGSS